jgi:3-hydroxybutyryl-CoA dehydrogenase
MTVGVPPVVGVLGAGQMGAGIAQLLAQAGARTLLYDPVPDARERGLARAREGIDRSQERGRVTAEAAEAARVLLEPAAGLEVLAPCGLVIEAAPESLELKRELLRKVAAAVADDCVLATNTSSLSITELAASVPHPERVVGLHFFNPVPVMRLAEVVAGEASTAQALALARAAGEAMGKTVIDASDIAGFLVNRVNRPFFLESLRVREEGVATIEAIDRIVRMGGGFRMGPFELMDLIGIETNHAVAESFWRQTYGEPRYRPSPLAARMIAAGRLGRKTGQGWYKYKDGEPQRVADPTPPAAGGGAGRTIVISGTLPVAAELRNAAKSAGWKVDERPGVEQDDVWLTIDAGEAAPRRAVGQSTPRAVLLNRGSLHLIDPEAAGFHILAPLSCARLAEVTKTPVTRTESASRLADLLATLGLHVEEVRDGPGLVLGRIVAQLVNEAAFLIGDGNGRAEDVDAGMELGLNHPRGPVAWSKATGLSHVVAILDALHGELREERYRAAPLLRRRAAIWMDLASTG